MPFPFTQYEQAWLEHPASIRIVLVIANYYDVATTSEKFLYLGTSAYNTTSGDVVFTPLLKGDLSLNESISKDNSVSMTFSDIELDNSNGGLDLYLNGSSYIWSNRTVEIYIGDPNWVSSNLADVKSRFRLVFNGVIDDIDSRDKTSINLKIRDRLERLNCAITENKLGTYGVWANTQQNQDTIKPLVFGEVFNMSPLLIDPSTLEYMVNDGPTEDIIEIRDNGVPVYTAGTLTSGATVNLTAGTFKLTSPPAGTITCSVQGVKNSVNLSTGALVSGTYNNTLANVVALIATQYGKSNTRLVASELDNTQLSSFNSINSVPVGLVVTDRINVLTALQSLASAKGAQIFMSREGKLQVIQYGTGLTSAQDTQITITSVTENDILYDSLSLVEKVQFVGSVKLGYCKNWTIQSGLQTNIPAEHKDLLATEWFQATSTNTTTINNYKLESDAPIKETYLMTQSDASSEATRLLNYYSTPRFVYRFSGTPKLLALRLGQQLTLIHSRFNLYNSGSGRTCQVVGITANWSRSTVDVEVIV